MSIKIIEIASGAGGGINEDRAGARGALAWVIDGATDIVSSPLTGAASDAAFAAETLDVTLRELAETIGAGGDDLSALPGLLSERLAGAFAGAKRREPAGRHEHPCASGLIVRGGGARLDCVSVGDCTLLAETTEGFVRFGVAEAEAGDPWVAQAIAAFQAQAGETTAEAARAHVWPKIAHVRTFMNLPEGYGVLSITQTPQRFVSTARFDLAPGGVALIASDGLMRLVDLYKCYSAEELLKSAVRAGVAGLIDEVHALERTDAQCTRFPRAKRHDDASGVLFAAR